jgi:hypothetical protein
MIFRSIQFFALGFLFTLCSVSDGLAQATSVSKLPAVEVTSTAAYAEVLFHQVQMNSELESLLVEYTESHPKVQELKYGVFLAMRESARLKQVKPGGEGKLTTALGKLMVGKIDAELGLWVLQQKYGDGHPDVKRAKRKVEIFEAAIKEILG